MKNIVQQVPKQLFAYMHRVGEYGIENHLLMELFKKWMKENNYLTDETIIYGIAWDNPVVTLPEQCRYDVGMVVSGEFSSSELQLKTLDGGVYLLIELAHTTEQIQLFWRQFMRLVTENECEFDDKRPILEQYTLNQIRNGRCTFYVPVKS